MKPLFILLAGACSACSQTPGTHADLAPREMNMAQATAGMPAPSPPCSEGSSEFGFEASAPHPFTGAWNVDGRTVDSDFFFVMMSDTNAYAPGQIFVWMQNSNGESLDLTVRPYGTSESFDRVFSGPAWEAASTAERAALVKSTIRDFAGRANGICGARAASLDDEMESFDRAFAELDRRD